ncbi:MAG: hypothetical protein KDA21_06685, partial [Phycisphaerales bacterium]|nr:hypothetical protein [Phycisphaerales bacterium]
NDFDFSNGTITWPNFNVNTNLDEVLSRLPQLLDALDTVLALFEDATDGEVLGLRLPFIGEEGLPRAGEFIGDVRAAVQTVRNIVATLSPENIRTELYNILGPNGADLLKPLDGSNGSNGITDYIDLDLFDDDNNTYTDRIEYRLNFFKEIRDTAAIGFDLGVPGLGLRLGDSNNPLAPATVDLLARFDALLHFGVSLDDGFYFVTDDGNAQTQDPPEIQIAAGVDLDPLDMGNPLLGSRDLDGRAAQLQGELGFLTLTAVDNGSALLAQIDVDIQDPGTVPDSKLTFDEFAAGPDIFAVDISGDAVIDFDATLDVGDRMPALTGQVLFTADLDVSLGEGAEIEFKSDLSFNDIEIDIGELITEFARPILDRVMVVLRPLQPVIDVLTQPIPVISDLAGQDVTLLDLSKGFLGSKGESAAKAVDQITQLIDLIKWLQEQQAIIAQGGTFVLPVGSVLIPIATGNGTAPGGPQFTAPSRDVERDARYRGGASLESDFTSRIEGFSDNEDQRNLAFPIIEDPLAQVAKLLTGKNVDLFTYTTPELVAGFDFGVRFGPLIPPIPLFVGLNGGLMARAQFSFGYDTFGIKKFIQAKQQTGSANALLLADGFYVQDKPGGMDVKEIELSGYIAASVELDLLVAEAGVEGGIRASVYADFREDVDDGDGEFDKIRLGTIFTNPLSTFKLGGELSAYVNAYVKLLFKEWEWNLANVKLLDFEVLFGTESAPAPTPKYTLSSMRDTRGITTQTLTLLDSTETDAFNVQIYNDGTSDRILVSDGTTQSDEALTGDLEILMAGNATSSDADYITISDDTSGGRANVLIDIDAGEGNDVLTVLAAGDITVRGGTGDDTIRVDGRAMPGLDANGSVTLYGGDGNDKLTYAGLADAILRGENDNDILTSGMGDDQLFGGMGDDRLTANEGADFIYGGGGNDALSGGAGNDELRGEQGDDNINGGDGND